MGFVWQFVDHCGSVVLIRIMRRRHNRNQKFWLGWYEMVWAKNGFIYCLLNTTPMVVARYWVYRCSILLFSGEHLRTCTLLSNTSAHAHFFLSSFHFNCTISLIEIVGCHDAACFIKFYFKQLFCENLSAVTICGRSTLQNLSGRSINDRSNC